MTAVVNAWSGWRAKSQSRSVVLLFMGGGKFVTSSCWTAEPSPALNERLLLAVLRGGACEAVKNLAVTQGKQQAQG